MKYGAVKQTKTIFDKKHQQRNCVQAEKLSVISDLLRYLQRFRSLKYKKKNKKSEYGNS